MSKFNVGQEVEVRQIADGMNEMHWSWRKAKIVCRDSAADSFHGVRECFKVQFPDGARAVFDAEKYQAHNGSKPMPEFFNIGQEVEVWCFPDGEWEKAKIAKITASGEYAVLFQDNTVDVFAEEHIRAVNL